MRAKALILMDSVVVRVTNRAKFRGERTPDTDIAPPFRQKLQCKCSSHGTLKSLSRVRAFCGSNHDAFCKEKMEKMDQKV